MRILGPSRRIPGAVEVERPDGEIVTVEPTALNAMMRDRSGGAVSARERDEYKAVSPTDVGGRGGDPYKYKRGYKGPSSADGERPEYKAAEDMVRRVLREESGAAASQEERDRMRRLAPAPDDRDPYKEPYKAEDDDRDPYKSRERDEFLRRLLGGGR